jgi:hypothetical protein
VDLKDATKKQHFVSQVEQRLNAINPQARNENKKIYSFRLLDRESYKLALDKEKGCKITDSLSLIDIFSFDVLEKNFERYNFEKLFHQYEYDIKINIESLISKISKCQADLKSEILNIFASKFINFIRKKLC